MLLKTEQDKILQYQRVETRLDEPFKMKSSLVLRIFSLYLILTLTNFIIFWLASGSNQMRLISEKAVIQTEKDSQKLVMALQDFLPNLRQLSAIKPLPATQLVTELESLLAKQQNPEIIQAFDLINLQGELLTQHKKSILNTNVDKARLAVKSLKSLQQREVKNRAFYASPDVENYFIELFVPLIVLEGQEIFFYTRLNQQSIQAELRSLYLLAILMVSVILILQTFFGFIIYRILLVPVKRLSAAALQVAAGDTLVQVNQGRKQDEIGRLIFIFNKMVATIHEKSAKLNTTIQDLVKRNKTIEYELKLAQFIQRGIMPETVDSDLIRAAISYGPLEQVSGDYYDLFTLPNGAVGFLIADASGHGIPAALITIMAKVHFASTAGGFSDPGNLFKTVNKEISRAIVTSDYLTAFYMILQPNLEMQFCNAGHQKILLFRKKSGQLEQLDAQGFFLGISEEAPFPYETKKMVLEKGDRLVLYTDGILDRFNRGREEYGLERLIQQVKNHVHTEVEEFNRLILADIEKFADGESRRDDYTLITIDIKG